MPIYEYRCLKCGNRFEKLLKSGNVDEIACTECGSAQVEKVLSVFGTGSSTTPACTSGG